MDAAAFRPLLESIVVALILVLLLIALAGLAAWTMPRWLVPRLAARSPRCLYSVPVIERVVALTLDDGPDSEHNLELLDLLRAHGARATFFLLADHINGREALVSAIVAGGHELGNHLMRDEPSVRMSPAEFEHAVRQADVALRQFASVRWLRPGSGWYTERMLDTMASAGYRCALGSVYPLDPHVPWPRVTAAYVLANTVPGAVIVLHEGGERGRRTIRILARVLPSLRAWGYRVVTLSELERQRQV